MLDMTEFCGTREGSRVTDDEGSLVTSMGYSVINTSHYYRSRSPDSALELVPHSLYCWPPPHP